jgi:polynucleotide 5'-hydroxyl-kinase GRC3/NOL9
MGQSDVGKTTLIRDLVRRVTARGDSIAVLDADLGQATFGLPTTLTLVRFAAGVTEPECIATFFVGAIFPVGHLLPTLVGCRLLLDRALQLRVHTILIDTTGLVAGPLGAEVKLQKIDLLRPTQIFALAHGSELDPILQACSHRQDLRVQILPIAAAARSRLPEERHPAREISPVFCAGDAVPFLGVFENLREKIYMLCNKREKS